MPFVKVEEGNVLKARIYDLNEKGAKQVLYAMVEILLKHPSVLSGVFIELVGDGAALANWEKRA